MAFSHIVETMSDIVREEVSRTAIELWRSRLNVFRAFGEKIRAKDFLALAERNDPFNADKYRVEAEWFVEQWHRFQPGESTVNVRGLHYDIAGLSSNPDTAVYLPNGTLYKNTRNRWIDLQRYGKYVRYLGLMSPDAFDDERSRTPVLQTFTQQSRSLYVSQYSSELYDCDLEAFDPFPSYPDFPSLDEFPSLPYYAFNIDGQQRYRLEVMIEKATKRNVIQPVCEKYQVTSLMAQGEIGILPLWELVKRAESYGDKTTTIILYLSDFDPAGQSMPLATARKIEFLRMLRRSSAKIRLYPIALTYDQCIEYKLPRVPMNETNARKAVFEERHGAGVTELDALEYFHRGEIAKLLERNILKFRDNTVDNRVLSKWSEYRDELRDLAQDIYANHSMDALVEEHRKAEEELQKLENAHEAYRQQFEYIEALYDDLEEEYDRDVRKKFDKWHSDYYEPLSYNIYKAMHNVAAEMTMKMPDVDEYEIPEAEEVPLNGDCLYDSEQPYIPTLARF